MNFECSVYTRSAAAYVVACKIIALLCIRFISQGHGKRSLNKRKYLIIGKWYDITIIII